MYNNKGLIDAMNTRLDYDPQKFVDQQQKVDPEKAEKAKQEWLRFKQEEKKNYRDIGDNILLKKEAELVFQSSQREAHGSLETIFYYDKEWVYGILRNKSLIKLPQQVLVNYVYAEKPRFIKLYEKNFKEAVGYL